MGAFSVCTRPRGQRCSRKDSLSCTEAFWRLSQRLPVLPHGALPGPPRSARLHRPCPCSHTAAGTLQEARSESAWLISALGCLRKSQNQLLNIYKIALGFGLGLGQRVCRGGETFRLHPGTSSPRGRCVTPLGWVPFAVLGAGPQHTDPSTLTFEGLFFCFQAFVAGVWECDRVSRPDAVSCNRAEHTNELHKLFCRFPGIFCAGSWVVCE